MGGMGGTGKTQVLKALIHLFHERKEDSRLLILAPTGAAAALINGFTIHSGLGLRSRGGKSNEDDISFSSATTLARIREQMEDVQYIFIDEISMVSTSMLYDISEQLTRIRGEPETAFGGFNMVFAGDFAQLPPVDAQPLQSGSMMVLLLAIMQNRMAT